MISLIFVLIDQIVKYFISEHFLLGVSRVVIPGFFNITYVHNTGAAFSILSGNTYIIIIITLILLYILYKYILKGDNLKWSKTIMLGGIISNLIDRIFRGYVIDFLDFNILGYNAPIFNIADICITLGALLLIIETLKEK